MARDHPGKRAVDGRQQERTWPPILPLAAAVATQPRLLAVRKSDSISDVRQSGSVAKPGVGRPPAALRGADARRLLGSGTRAFCVFGSRRGRRGTYHHPLTRQVANRLVWWGRHDGDVDAGGESEVAGSGTEQ